MAAGSMAAGIQRNIPHKSQTQSAALWKMIKKSKKKSPSLKIMCDIDSTKKALLRRNLNDDNRRKMRTFITSPVNTHQIQGPGREIEYVKVTKPCLQDGGETLKKKIDKLTSRRLFKWRIQWSGDTPRRPLFA